MINTCAGCGEGTEIITSALSRYGHGELCTDCGIFEAGCGDFIKKYGDEYSPDFPIEVLKAKLMNGEI